MLWIFISVFAVFIKTGYGTSHASSVMFGPKPILRMTEPDDDDDDAEHKELLNEPSWVSNLRTTIENQVKNLGLLKAGASIQKLISDVADDVKNLELQGDEEPDETDYSQKKGLRTIAAAAEKKHPNKPLLTGEPLWMIDLKSFVKDLISTRGKADLEGFVRPVISSVEKNHNVKIKDIDGEIFINYENIAKPKSSKTSQLRNSKKSKSKHRSRRHHYNDYYIHNEYA